MTDTTKSMRTLAARDGHAVTWSDTKPPKLQLPPVPAHDDLAGLAAWLTAVFNLDAAHPITGAELTGSGQVGRVELRRAGAPALHFEPARNMNMASRLSAELVWQLRPSDGEPFGFKNDHAKTISYVVRLLCGITAGATDEQETLRDRRHVPERCGGRRRVHDVRHQPATLRSGRRATARS